MALIVVRLWRFVRIGHGIFASTHSVAKEKSDKLHEEIRVLEEEYIRALNHAAALATTTRPKRLCPGAGGRGERPHLWNEGCRLTVLPRLASAPSSTSGSPSATRPPPLCGRSPSEASAATHDLQGAAAGGEKLADGVAAALSERSNTPTSPVGAPAMRRPPAAAPLGAAHRALQLGASSSAARTGMQGVGTGMGAGEAVAAERQAPPAAEPEPAGGAAAAESVELELDALDMST